MVGLNSSGTVENGGIFRISQVQKLDFFFSLSLASFQFSQLKKKTQLKTHGGGGGWGGAVYTLNPSI